MPTTILRPPVEAECAALSELCLRSKAVWGYDRAFLEACREALSIRPADLATGLLQVAEVEGDIAGVVQLTAENGEFHLDKLFIDPAFQKHGLGRTLMGWAATRARENGVRRLIIEADPGAAPFYRRMGAIDIGQAPSGSIPGRFLPLLALDI